MKLLVINGPNLGKLGQRDSLHYGSLTLEQINELVAQEAERAGVDTEFFQSNHEGFIIDRLEQGGFDALLINPGALAHYSYSLADAVRELSCPKVEVHLSDIKQREPFRSVRVLDGVVDGIFYGEKEISYLKGTERVIKLCYEKGQSHATK